jgi:hypothetical protein
MKLNKVLRRLFVFFIATCVFTGCTLPIKMHKIKFGEVNTHAEILNLQRASALSPPALKQEVEKVMSNVVNANGEPMGYYTVNVSNETDVPDANVTIQTICCCLCYVPNLLGVPYWMIDKYCSVSLNIFDSNGNLIGSYKKDRWFRIYSSFYYGYGSTRKAGKVYTKLFEDILQQVSAKSQSINDLLNAAGPITAQNTAAAKSKINETLASQYKKPAPQQPTYQQPTYQQPTYQQPNTYTQQTCICCGGKGYTEQYKSVATYGMPCNTKCSTCGGNGCDHVHTQQRCGCCNGTGKR